VLESVLSVINAGDVNAFGEDLDEDGHSPLPGGGVNGRPLPVAEPEWPEGRVPHDSKFYIVRPFIEKDSFKHIMTPGALIRIRAPRQMGKTSLLARILYHAQKRGCGTGQISFQLVAATTFSDLPNFLRYFCRNVTRLMKLPNRLDELWDERNDPVDNCTTYFIDHLLTETPGDFVLGLDETDRLFEYPNIAKEFFGMMRGWMDGATNDALWRKFRVVLVHSTECYITLPVNQSPFNIGRGFRLPPFSEKELKRLIARHGLSLNEEIRDLVDLLAGHPYLIRLALYYVARKEKTVTDIMKEAHTEAGIFSDHLRRHYWNLSQHPQLVNAVKSIVGSRVAVSVDSVAAFQLEGMGLVKRVGNKVAISCELHKRYFQDVFHITV
jgi:serine/threonine-protein kinase